MGTDRKAVEQRIAQLRKVLAPLQEELGILLDTAATLRRLDRRAQRRAAKLGHAAEAQDIPAWPQAPREDGAAQ